MNRTIYTFWEPRNRIVPYIELCMEKWEPFIQGFDHVLLDYSNLWEHIPKDSIDPEKFSSVYFGLQKDIVQAAVLKHNGGIFIDADMILVNDLSPLFEFLRNYEIVTFASHMAFMMARPGALLVHEWYEEVLNRIERLENKKGVKWDHFANNIVNEKLKDKKYNALQIDKYRTAFTPESIYFPNSTSAMEKYLSFWLSEDISAQNVFYEGQYMIALHNSWTPEWYQNLSRRQVLDHPCLLSKILREELKDSDDRKRLRISWIRLLMIRFFLRVNGLKRRLKWLLK